MAFCISYNTRVIEKLDIVFRIIAIALFFARIGIWRLEEKRTIKAKPIARLTFKSLDYRTGARLAIGLVHLILLLQLFDLSILPITHNTIVFQLVGICLAVTAFAVGVMARKELGSNWAHASDYQIKKKHELVTSGVYRYIRHPIYTSMSLFIVGCELVALSSLFLPLGFLLFFMSYVQAKKEEKILLGHFGEKYEVYRSHSKMLFPYIF